MLEFTSEDGGCTKSGDDNEIKEDGGGQGNDLFADSLQRGDAGDPYDDPTSVNPSPLIPACHTSPHCSLPSMSYSMDMHWQATLATANEGVTPSAPTMDAPYALKKAGSTIKATNTKILSNKNKECTLIAGPIGS